MAGPVHFSCRRVVRIDAEAIAERMLDLDSWISFRGWGPLPGVRRASFRRRTEGVVGTQIEVQNLDGSGHLEEITEWRPGVAIAMRFSELSPPLRGLATHFIESWSFEPSPEPGPGSLVTRRFELYPRRWWARPALALIASMLRRAVERHLRELDAASKARPTP